MLMKNHFKLFATLRKIYRNFFRKMYKSKQRQIEEHLNGLLDVGRYAEKYCSRPGPYYEDAMMLSTK